MHIGTWQIIAISIVLTLLSVATPLGFQTFTDKVLPYAAGNSLVVIITLLTLAMLVSILLDCFKNYQQSVLLSKYQNGLGKEVFRRLLGMEISYFDKHSVGDLTKLFAGIVRNMTNPFFTQWVDVLERSSTLFESILIVRHTPAITGLECPPEIGHRG